MARLTTDKKATILGALVEGNSIRSTERMTGVHRDTITKLVVETGRKAERIMDEEIRHFSPEQIEMDEIWCFVGKKRAQLKRTDDVTRVGDAWTWVALDPDSKLVPAHHVGRRKDADAQILTKQLARRIEGRVQISTDKLYAYRHAISLHLGGSIHNDTKVDYGRIVKRYKGAPLDTGRYSPPEVVAIDKDAVYGNPDPDRICTSHVERQNLTMRMGMRRFTRLTNGFSKKIENLRAATALHFVHYNFVRCHSTIKTTPALASGIADHRWTLEELVDAPY
ncbi:MAG: IS1 family transposase [bacterium]|nr:IS1 family transposase [bacterium]